MVRVEDRSYQIITIEDLKQLQDLALREREKFFKRNPHLKKAYHGSVIAIALCQGTALHFIDHNTGVKDFDIWYFYVKNPEVGYPYMARKRVDSKLGKFSVHPEVWGEAIKIANERVGQKSELGTLVFASALNLLLFSRTYGESILNRLRKIVEEDKSKSYLFTVSTSAYREKIRTLENAADNLMFTRPGEDPMTLLFKITRMKDVDFPKKEVKVPIKAKDLRTIRDLAEGSRRNLIPVISKI